MGAPVEADAVDGGAAGCGARGDEAAAPAVELAAEHLHRVAAAQGGGVVGHQTGGGTERADGLLIATHLAVADYGVGAGGLPGQAVAPGQVAHGGVEAVEVGAPGPEKYEPRDDGPLLEDLAVAHLAHYLLHGIVDLAQGDAGVGQAGCDVGEGDMAPQVHGVPVLGVVGERGGNGGAQVCHLTGSDAGGGGKGGDEGVGGALADAGGDVGGGDAACHGSVGPQGAGSVGPQGAGGVGGHGRRYKAVARQQRPDQRREVALQLAGRGVNLFERKEVFVLGPCVSVDYGPDIVVVAGVVVLAEPGDLVIAHAAGVYGHEQDVLGKLQVGLRLIVGRDDGPEFGEGAGVEGVCQPGGAL